MMIILNHHILYTSRLYENLNIIKKNRRTNTDNISYL